MKKWAHKPNIHRDFLKSEGYPGGSDSKETACDAGDMGFIPESGRSPGEENGYPLQYSCLGNSMDRGAWRAIVLRVAKNRMRLNDFQVFFFFTFTEKLHTEIFLR